MFWLDQVARAMMEEGLPFQIRQGLSRFAGDHST